VRAALWDFFGLQWKARGRAGKPGDIPLSRVDCPLDAEIPFNPAWAKIYLYFVGFWVGELAVLLKEIKQSDKPLKPALAQITGFIDGMVDIYKAAASVYRENLSTTERPRSGGGARFALIRATDPHLLCVPSLHVMIAVYTWKRVAASRRSLGVLTPVNSAKPRSGEVPVLPEIEAGLRRTAILIGQSLLYARQHSVNCVAAGLYAVRRYAPQYVTDADCLDFAQSLFTIDDGVGGAAVSDETARKARDHIAELYTRFVREGAGTADWRAPLLDFLRETRT
jgi:hypothetical protein